MKKELIQPGVLVYEPTNDAFNSLNEDILLMIVDHEARLAAMEREVTL